MANLTTSTQTSLSCEEAITRAIQFFTTEKWRATTQSSRSATFEGRPPIPIGSIILMLVLIPTVIGFFIMYFLVVKKMYKFQNLVITTAPIEKGAEVLITYPSYAKKLVKQFIDSLPKLL